MLAEPKLKTAELVELDGFQGEMIVGADSIGTLTLPDDLERLITPTALKRTTLPNTQGEIVARMLWASKEAGEFVGVSLEEITQGIQDELVDYLEEQPRAVTRSVDQLRVALGRLDTVDLRALREDLGKTKASDPKPVLTSAIARVSQQAEGGHEPQSLIDIILDAVSGLLIGGYIKFEVVGRTKRLMPTEKLLKTLLVGKIEQPAPRFTPVAAA